MAQPSATRDAMDEAIRLLLQSARILITSHIRLDGDAIASELALSRSLTAAGKHVDVVNDGLVPKVYRFLPGASDVGSSADGLGEDYELVAVLDAAGRSRLGAVASVLSRGVKILNVDHHPDNEMFGDVNWVETGRSSVGEMVYLLLKRASFPLSPEVATCLYVAIMTDTGRFTFSNTTPDSLRVAAELIEAGADYSGAAHQIYRSEPRAVLRLRAMMAQGIRFTAGGKIVCARVTRDMLKSTGVDPVDTQEFADISRSIEGVVVGVLLREMDEPGVVKVSLRGSYGVVVNETAREFGGGGHPYAAGCEVRGTIDEVERKIVEDLSARLAPCKQKGA